MEQRELFNQDFINNQSNCGEFDYDKFSAWINAWGPCVSCGNNDGNWSGYALAVWHIYLCMPCFRKHCPEVA
jgi:hypothetical protein